MALSSPDFSVFLFGQLRNFNKFREHNSIRLNNGKLSIKIFGASKRHPLGAWLQSSCIKNIFEIYMHHFSL
jgi:hypothetical protein